MFAIADGREHFYQWDSNRRVVVDDPTITEVHFCNRTDDCSLVVEVVDGLADVPNILLQNDFPIRVYAYCSDGYTKVENTFKVRSRTKPDDYVYTETEIKSYQALEDRIEELEKTGSADLSNYYTKEEVDNELAKINECDTYFFNAIEYPWSEKPALNPNYAPDNLIEFAERFLAGEGVSLYVGENFGDETIEPRWIPCVFVKVNDTQIAFGRMITGYDVVHQPIDYEYKITNGSKGWTLSKQGIIGNSFASKDYVDDAIANIDIPEPDLTGYATEQYVDDAISNIDIPDVSKYQTADQVTALINDALAGIATAEGGSY